MVIVTYKTFPIFTRQLGRPSRDLQTIDHNKLWGRREEEQAIHRDVHAFHHGFFEC